MHCAYADYFYRQTVAVAGVDRTECVGALFGAYEDEYSLMISHHSDETNTIVCYFYQGYLARGQSQDIWISGVAGVRPYGNMARYHYPTWDVSATRGPSSLHVAADCNLSMSVYLYRNDNYGTLVAQKYVYGTRSMATFAPYRFNSAKIRLTRPSVVSPTPSPSGC
jgi:hypothetical protein